MKKNFDKWNSLKKRLHEKNRIIHFHTREIWWCSLGLNIGFEQDGKNKYFERPILVFKKFNNHIFWALPLTKSCKNGKYYCSFEHEGDRYSVILSQVRLICAKRLLRRIRVLTKDDFEIVKKGYKKLI